MSVKIRPYIEKATTSVPSLKWLFGPKDEWTNDRVEFGPFTTKSEDKQRERVFLNMDRLEFIYKHGHLIYEHHMNPGEPVVILGDCLGIATDQMGKTYGLWGWYSGSETIDKKWEESQTFAEGMGYSIGGKRTNVICDKNKSVCTLDNPEVLEVSKVKTPANGECMVHYINQFAKSMILKSEAGESAHEFHLAVKKFKKKMEDTYKLDPTYDPPFDHFWGTHPCVVDYIRGLEEMGVKKVEAIDMFNDFKETIRKGTVKRMSEETISKEQMAPPAPTATAPQQQGSGNVTLDLLNQILQAIQALGVSRVNQAQAQPPNGAGPQDGNGPPQPGAEKSDQAEATNEQRREEEEDHNPPEKKKEVKKTEGSLNLGDGENPSPAGPNPDVKETAKDTSSVVGGPGENPTPPGPNPEMKEKPADRGDKGHEDSSTLPGLGGGGDGKPSGKVPSQTYETVAHKTAIAPKPEPVTIEQIMKAKGFVIVKNNARPEKVYDDPKAQAGLDGKQVESATVKKSGTLWEQIKQNKISIKKETVI